MRVVSGIQPTGNLHLGNYLGAIKQWVAMQDAMKSGEECLFFLADLHALSQPLVAAELASNTIEMAATLLACGIDPDRSILFNQARVPAHSELAWILGGTARMGWLNRMTQWKDKAGKSGESQSVAMFTYPVLQAADVLLYQATHVPVGADQAQHVELTRDLAERFNRRYGEVFTLPRAIHPPTAARVMDLATPESKMSKSIDSPGTIFLLDPVDVVRRKIMRAVTDSGTSVTYDPESKPGVSNLLAILSACTQTPVEDLSPGSYGALKKETADAVIALLEPLQREYAYLSADPATLEAILRTGAERAREQAAGTVTAAKEAMGLLAA